MSIQAIGIDIGRTNTKLGSIPEDGEIPIEEGCVFGVSLPDDVLKKIYRANTMNVSRIEQNA